jgi:hypothetical protein
MNLAPFHGSLGLYSHNISDLQFAQRDVKHTIYRAYNILLLNLFDWVLMFFATFSNFFQLYCGVQFLMGEVKSQIQGIWEAQVNLQTFPYTQLGLSARLESALTGGDVRYCYLNICLN